MTDLLTIPRNGGEETRLSLSEYKGREFLSLRIYFDAGGGEMRPSPKGCTIPLAAIPDMIEALQRADAMTRETTGDSG